MCVLCSISQRKTFPGEKLPALSFGDGERDNSIVGFVPSPLQPLKYDLCHSPVNAGPRCHCFSPASWETEEFHNDCLFFRGLLCNCVQDSETSMEKSRWRDTTDQVPFPPAEDKNQEGCREDRLLYLPCFATIDTPAS